MMDDAMDSLDDPDLEEQADVEVEKVLWELTEGKLGEAPRVLDDSLPAGSSRTKVPSGGVKARTPALSNPDVAEGDEEEDLETMRQRLSELKSWRSKETVLFLVLFNCKNEFLSSLSPFYVNPQLMFYRYRFISTSVA